MGTQEMAGGVAEMEAAAGARARQGAGADCPMCSKSRGPNAKAIAAFEECERLMKDPNSRRGYTSAKELFADMDADVDD
jgi:hypothetical protein